MPTMLDHSTQRCLQLTQLVTYPPNSLYNNPLTLTAPADRPVRDLAYAVAFTTAVAIAGAASIRRLTGMRAARHAQLHPTNTASTRTRAYLQKTEVQVILKEPHHARGPSS